MAVQSSFNSGEWAPALNARVDLAKYHSGAALLQNFFVDYRGGASTRPGTAYVIQAFISAMPVRLIPFQASFNVGYCLEFGNFYMRPLFDGQPILETTFAISGATQANPCVLTVTGNNYNLGDWIFISMVVGMTQLNGRYFSISAVAGASITLADLNGVAINSIAFGAYVSGGTTARLYKIQSPFAAADLALVKFVQNVDTMIMCHLNYPPQTLTLTNPTSWAISAVVIGSTVSPPTSVAVTTSLSAGSANYSYVVTSIDQNGQESAPSIAGTLTGRLDIRSNAGTNIISWTGAIGAVSYNVYEAVVSLFGVVPPGINYGFIGSCIGTSFVDSNIGPDFSVSPPVVADPFIGGDLLSVTVTAAGSYTTFPTVVTSSGSPTVAAVLSPVLNLASANLTTTTNATNYFVGEGIEFQNGIILIIQSLGGGFTHTVVFHPLNYPGTNLGSISAGPLPSSITSIDTHTTVSSVTWGVYQVTVNSPGFGYNTTTPAITFSPTGATATAVASALSGTNPAVPGLFQQRLVLASTANLPQTFWMSEPGLYYNFNTSMISNPKDSIEGTLVSGVLNTIKAFVPASAGLLVLTDKASWVVNGGAAYAAISPATINATAQSYIGANDVPPIVANYDVLYVQSKGSGVYDLAFNIYVSVFTGTDISIISSHLFFGHQILQWAWANFPFYVAWAIRDDGVMLSLTYIKEQDFIAWAQHNTQGSFNSVAAVTESTVSAGNVDAIYVVVQRTVNGNVVQYIERMADRVYPTGVKSAWAVDSGQQFSGSPATTFQGAEHLAGLTVTGLADGAIIPPFTMPVSGIFTLGVAASLVTVGLGFTCNLQTLAIDIGEPSIQGKVKKIPYVDVRVKDTLGLSIGNDANSLVPMQDLIVGNVSSTLTGQAAQVVTDLVTGDARTFLGPTYTVPGQYYIRQSNPFPASILGVFPALVVGDQL
jgi:hypothetical protein